MKISEIHLRSYIRNLSLRGGNPIFSSSLYFSLSTMAVSAFGFFYWWVAARFYPDETVGKFVVILSTAQLITTFANFGLSFGIIRFLPSYDNQKSKMINFSIIVVSLTTLIVSFTTIFFGSGISPVLSQLKHDESEMIMFVLFTDLLAIFQILNPILASLRKANILMWLNFGSSLLRLIMLLFIFPKTLMALFLTYLIPNTLGAFIILIIVLPQILPGYKFSIDCNIGGVKKLFGYSFWSFVGNFLHDLPGQLLPHIITTFISIAAAAHYNVVWSIYGFLSTIGNSVALSLFVEGSNRNIKTKFIPKRVFISALFISFSIAIIVMIAARPILLVFGKEYSSATNLLIIMSFSTIPATLNYLFVSSLRISNNLLKIVLVFAIVASVCVLLGVSGFINSLDRLGIVWLLAQCIASLYLFMAVMGSKGLFTLSRKTALEEKEL